MCRIKGSSSSLRHTCPRPRLSKTRLVLSEFEIYVRLLPSQLTFRLRRHLTRQLKLEGPRLFRTELVDGGEIEGEGMERVALAD